LQWNASCLLWPALTLITQTIYYAWIIVF
jgi:hypothetical protein